MIITRCPGQRNVWLPRLDALPIPSKLKLSVFDEKEVVPPQIFLPGVCLQPNLCRINISLLVTSSYPERENIAKNKRPIHPESVLSPEMNTPERIKRSNASSRKMIENSEDMRATHTQIPRLGTAAKRASQWPCSSRESAVPRRGAQRRCAPRCR